MNIYIDFDKCISPSSIDLSLSVKKEKERPIQGSHTVKKYTKITPVTRSAFACGLGSTDSCPTTVHMKPFSASVLQDPSGVFATTTKICTDGGSGQAHAHNPSTLTVATPLLVGA